MKKFLTALLATSILIPSPILANEEMESMDEISFEQEEMNIFKEETEVASLDETSGMNESTSINNTCTVTFQTKDGMTLNSVNVPIKDTVISRLDLIRYIPNGYHFIQEPKDIEYKSGVSTYTVEIANTSSDQSKWALPNDGGPCVLNYKDSASGTSYWLDFEAWNKAASNNEISASKLTTKLKEVDSNAPYTIKTSVKRDQLDSVFYLSGSSLTVCGYRFSENKPSDLKRVTTNLETRKITVQLGNEICELQAGDFKDSSNSSTSAVDTNGNVKVNANTLQNALNAMAKRTNKNYKNGTFTVTGTLVPNTLSVYTTTPTKITGATVKLSLSSQSYIGIQFTGQNSTFGTTYIKLGDIDKSKDFGKVTFEEKRNYLNSYSKDLVLAETNDNKSDSIFTNIDFIDMKGTIPTCTIDVIPAKDPDTLYNQTFTISFVDSETGKSVSSDDSRVWSNFFKTGPGVELNTSNMIADLLPTGYGVALEQISSSTAQTKKKLSSLSAQGNFSFSILGPKKVTLYVTKLEGYKENTGGHIATKPDTPTPVEPDAPQAPVQPPEQPAVTPTQGKQHMFRLYNKTTGEHLYTGSAAEKEKLLAENSGWSDEGQGWIAAVVSAYPVYRLFNPNSGEHHYTKDKNEYETLIRYGWKGEDKAFFSADDINNKITVYRLYNSTAPDIAKHHYTTSKEERDKLIGEGWTDEGTGWYGMPLE